MYAANEELLRMNWDIGEMLTKSQETDGWGKKTLQRLTVDLKNEYPERKGFSVRNMQCMMQFYNEYNKELTMVKVGHFSIAQPLVAQLKNNVNTLAIKLEYYGKHGALANNFDTTLPATEALEVKSLLKDPYIFDMLTFTDQYDERDIEIGLIKHIEKFLVEMGAGFAFMGRQYHIEVSGDDYYIDMLMYNTFMHRYLVIELKATDFMPEYILLCRKIFAAAFLPLKKSKRDSTNGIKNNIQYAVLNSESRIFSFCINPQHFHLNIWRLRGKVVTLPPTNKDKA